VIRLLTILILTCAWSLSSAQVNIITTIAGKETYGYSGDGGPATNAELKGPVYICRSKTHLYISDGLNHSVRYVDNVTGVIETFSGGGTPGYAGDGSSSLSAKFRIPQGISCDTAGNVYIGDALNFRIRKIDKLSGLIATVVGNGSQGYSGDMGPATAAELDGIVGLCVDVYGNIYFVDWTNNKLRKVSVATGIIETIAGTGIAGSSGDGGLATNAQLNRPSQIAIEKSEDIIIAEQKGHVVRRIKTATGIITTIAGTGSAGYSGDGGAATNARLNQPSGLFVDKQNNIYIAEYGNGTIRRIDGATGIITTVAGTGTTGFSGDGGPATDAKLFCSDVLVDDDGNLIIADYENNRIRKVSSGVAVNGIDKDVEAGLYPNPTNGIFSVQTPAAICLVNVYNIGGMLVHEQTCIGTETQVDISAQPPGVYMVYVRCGENMYVSKVVKI
jgi:trimeric autotransporter adhesin